MMRARIFSGRGSVLKRNRGASTLGCLFFVAVIGVAGYVGVKVGEAYWEYFEVRQKTRDTLSWAVAGQPKNEAAIAQKLIANVSEVGVELTLRNIKVRLTRDTLTLTVVWMRDVAFPGYTLPLTFNILMTDEIRWYKGGLVIKK